MLPSDCLYPYQQARRYAGYLPHDQNPRWIIVCNFQEFQIHDMNRPNDEPEVLKLADLEKEFHRLQFWWTLAASISKRKWRYPSRRANWLAYSMTHS